MANWSDPRIDGRTGAAPFGRAQTGTVAAGYDAGLRAYMLSVYNYMASGVLLTGIVALLGAKFGLVEQMVSASGKGMSPLGWLIALAPLAIVLVMSFGQSRLSTPTLKGLFWAYAVLMGASLSTIFYAYTQGSIAGAFFATAAGFAGLSLWGYTTERDLSPMGTFLLVGLIGLIVASLLALWLPGLNLVVSIVGVLIFAGLTAYDTQRIKSQYSYVAGTPQVDRVVVMSALNLYLDFINMFLFVLRLFGSSRN